VRGHARFVGPRLVEADGRAFAAETVIIDVGARPAVPAVPGLSTVEYLDNTTAMQLREVPRNLLVLGGGYIGCEFGQMFRRFGAGVTLVDHAPHLIDREDPDVSEALEAVLTAEGLGMELGVRVTGVRREGNGSIVLSVGGGEIDGSHLLVAAGRRPNTDDLGCEAGGIELDARGFVTVADDYMTSAEGVYAVGDAAGGPQFTHSSWDDHRILYDLLAAQGTRRRGDRLIPFTVFTDPQVAGVGLNEREARARGIAFEAARMPFGSVARAVEVDEKAGMMKVLIDPSTERILGARIVGAEAGELIHVFVSLMQARVSARAIVDTEFVHPTFAEGVQSLVMRLPRYALT
jgi:pyruvate/2-oxoglutarate dehydrogenase complex dihydrolipoamide dehydrogenase (E3) component